LSTLIIDQRRRSAVLEDREIQLTPQEYRLLADLARRPGEVVSKAALATAMWGSAEGAAIPAQSNPMAIDLVVFRLRKKLGDKAQHPRYLETRRGFGYLLHNAEMIFTASSDAVAPSAAAPPPKLLARPLLTPFSDELLQRVDGWSQLTPREWELFMLLGQEETAQLTNYALAQQLGMAANTLKKHLQNLYRKLGVSNRAAAAVLSAHVQLQLYTEQRLLKGIDTMTTRERQHENETIVRRYYQAVADRDTAVVAPYLAEEVMRIGIIFPNEPPVITRGKAALLARIQRVIDDNGAIQVSNVRADGDKVTCHAQISTDMGRREGIAPLDEEVEFLLQDGKILSFKVVSTPESAAKIRTGMA
jgi:DNA-binding CsgD family transcriptional regulator/DNA-binding winged helix-turn-helix (wHTH) protein/ketosteroid isomerase-like protein